MKGSLRPTQPCVTKQGLGSLATITPCPWEVHRETQKSSPPFPSGERPRIDGLGLHLGREGNCRRPGVFPLHQLVLGPLTRPHRDPSVLTSRGKTSWLTNPALGLNFSTARWFGLFVRPSQQAAHNLPSLVKASCTWNHEPETLLAGECLFSVKSQNFEALAHPRSAEPAGRVLPAPGLHRSTWTLDSGRPEH